ncbi:MAG: hypothetical protein UR80_C0050G0001, partial [Parcubacteria group bacterium GW2011_GWB1_35_5]
IEDIKEILPILKEIDKQKALEETLKAEEATTTKEN